MCDKVSEYEQFRIERKIRNQDDENSSAHYSIHYQGSQTRTDRDLSSFRSEMQDPLELKQAQYDQLAVKFKQLTASYERAKASQESAIKEAQKYKDLYQRKIQKQAITKNELKNWVKEAKLNLDKS